MTLRGEKRVFPFKKHESTGFRRKYDNPSRPGKYEVLLRPGYTAIVGPDWSNKEKLLEQVCKAAKKACWTVIQITGSLFTKGSADAAIERIQSLVETAADADDPLLVALEYPEGGASVDLVMDLRESISEILQMAGWQPGGMEKPVYIVAVTNAYAMAEGCCIDARDGRSRVFSNYSGFARSMIQDGAIRT